MVAVGYGDATKQSKPGFYVLRKATGEWIRIDKVSTRSAIFGRSPTFEEAKAVGQIIPSIGWDFRSLSKNTHVDFPLKSSGFLFFPDKVERDEERKEYVLRFYSGSKIKGVETVLKLSIHELTKIDLEQENPPGKMKPRQIFLISVIHFLASRVLFLWVFGREMQLFDTGRSPTVVETAAALVSRAFDFPMSLVFGLVPHGWFPGLVGYIPLAINSLIWGVIFSLVISRSFNGNPENYA
jgi:hypothetical protein